MARLERFLLRQGEKAENCRSCGGRIAVPDEPGVTVLGYCHICVFLNGNPHFEHSKDADKPLTMADLDRAIEKAFRPPHERATD